jgi:hypothetical protein
MQLTPGKAPELWVPGAGLVPANIAQAELAVKEYSADLRLGQTPEGEWVVAMKQGPDGEYFPVLGLGYELPSADLIKERLYKADTRRRGGEIVKEVQKRNDARQQKVKDEASDGAGIAAEAFDWAARKEGVHPNPRIFVP